MCYFLICNQRVGSSSLSAGTSFSQTNQTVKTTPLIDALTRFGTGLKSLFILRSSNLLTHTQRVNLHLRKI